MIDGQKNIKLTRIIYVLVSEIKKSRSQTRYTVGVLF